MKNLKFNLYVKIGAIILIILLLLIPTSMIRSLIHERERTQDEAIREVNSKWAEEQYLEGPFISIPYIKNVKEYSREEGKDKIIQIKEYIHVLPEKLEITGEVNPEKRYRGIYEIVVYNSKLKISGFFNPIDFVELGIETKNIKFDKAEFVLGINDLRGIEKQISLKWAEEEMFFNPGVSSKDIVRSGINAQIDIDPDDSSQIHFSMDIDLNGSQMLYFTPVGKVTDVTINSDWKNPSFNGAFLPDTRNVSDTGFFAHWNVLHLNRNFPQIWTSSQHHIKNSAFGVDLKLPVDSYQKSYRSIQYAILFIVFTFLVFFFIEVLNKILIHPIHYILVGLALVIFFTLLLSLSEHIPFNFAFILSSLATLILISGYVKAILKSKKLTALIASILFILYAFIYIVIQIQDYALLIGSLGLFIILSLVMYFARKVDWYNLNEEGQA
jgi:inner membrane protein